MGSLTQEEGDRDGKLIADLFEKNSYKMKHGAEMFHERDKGRHFLIVRVLFVWRM